MNMNIENLMHIHDCVDIAGLTDDLVNVNFAIILGNERNISDQLLCEFGDAYDLQEMIDDIEELIPFAMVVGNGTDLFVLNCNTTPEDFVIC